MKLDRFIRSRQDGSLAAALQRFLTYKLRVTSRANTEHLFESLYPLVKALPELQAISYDDLRQQRMKLRGRYATGSIRSKLVDWRTFFRWCKREKLITVNPAKGLKLPTVRPKDKAAANEDILAVLRSLADKLRGHVYRTVFGPLELTPGAVWNKWQRHAARDLFLLTFMYETGARAGEVANLLTVQMERSLAAPLGPSRDVYEIELFGKTEERLRAFTEATAELWRIWQQVRPKKGAREYALVVWREKDKPAAALDAAEVSQILVRRCRQAGVGEFRAHAVRHAKAKRSRQYGGIEVAMALLDHSDITSTLFYVQDNDNLQNAVLATGLKTDLFDGGSTLD